MPEGSTGVCLRSCSWASFLLEPFLEGWSFHKWDPTLILQRARKYEAQLL